MAYLGESCLPVAVVQHPYILHFHDRVRMECNNHNNILPMAFFTVLLGRGVVWSRRFSDDERYLSSTIMRVAPTYHWNDPF